MEGLSEEKVLAEASRCLHCGECFKCGNCFNFCPDAAIHVDEQGRMRIDYDYCKGCGICVQECPCSAMHFEKIEEEV
jgi:2-oxoacid:acceptor oxidoreductase delta subunit (pyruvate/2-ketoisovalerate family)